MEELELQLKELSVKLEGKTAVEIKSAMEAFEVKLTATNKAQFAEEIKSIQDLMQGKLDAMQGQYDELDVKMQTKARQSEGEPTFGGELVKGIKENITSIAKVEKKGNNFNLELKAVGNMTLGANLTGAQPKDYSFDVAMVPSQAVNFSDLVASIQISGGTYTFPRETTSEGAIAIQTEGASKSQIDYDISMIDVNTDFLAGYARYSKKMANNLPFLESFLPRALRRDYFKAENAKFYADLIAVATASTVILGNYIERLISDIAGLNVRNYSVTGIVINPADWWKIQVTEKSTGAGYGLPGVVTYNNGVLRINGIPIYMATWVPVNKYLVGDWSYVQKVVTEGLSVEFSTEDADNFTKNNITARVESQIALAVERPDAIVVGDFTAVV